MIVSRLVYVMWHFPFIIVHRRHHHHRVSPISPRANTLFCTKPFYQSLVGISLVWGVNSYANKKVWIWTREKREKKITRKLAANGQSKWFLCFKIDSIANSITFNWSPQRPSHVTKTIKFICLWSSQQHNVNNLWPARPRLWKIWQLPRFCRFETIFHFYRQTTSFNQQFRVALHSFAKTLPRINVHKLLESIR